MLQNTNGNIQGLDRYNGAAVNRHDFDTYAYSTNTNRLGDISDGTTSTAVKLRKYTYDASSRTVKEEVTGALDKTMSYDPAGMVTTVKKDGKMLQFNEFSDGGHRYKQTVYSATGTAVKETYYVHDSEGNVMAVYEKDLTATNPAIALTELPIMGLGRVGNMQISGTVENYSYELSDHLGNVRVVFDRTLQVSNVPSISHFADYYPFGLPIPGRGVDGYRYGYHGQFAEYDKGTTGLYSFFWRNYDSEVGRWKNVDPYNQFWSPYLGMGNNPVTGLDPDGGWSWHANLSFFANIYGNLRYAFTGKSVTIKFNKGGKEFGRFNFGASSSIKSNFDIKIDLINLPIHGGGKWPNYSGTAEMSGDRNYDFKFNKSGGDGDYKAEFSSPNGRFIGNNKVKNVDGRLGQVDIQISPDPNSNWNKEARRRDSETFGGNDNASFGFGGSAPITQTSRLKNPINYGIHHYGFLGLGTYYTINRTRVVSKKPW